MARYDKSKIFEKAIKAIEDEELFFIEDIVAFVPIVKQTLYDYFPIDSYEMDTFKAMLNNNKIRVKSKIRKKLFKSEKAAELLALYRLVSSPEEHRLLNQQYIEQTNEQKGDIIVRPERPNDE